MQVKELMTPQPACVQTTDTIQHAAQEMRQHSVGSLPVCSGDDLAGIITDRDIAIECVAAGRNPAEVQVSEYMTANPVCIDQEASTEEAYNLMAQEQIRRLCVKDRDRFVGIISLGDLAVQALDERMLSRTLARISQPVRAGEPSFR